MVSHAAALTNPHKCQRPSVLLSSLQVYGRALSVATRLGGFITSVVGDAALGNLEKNQRKRAVELRNLLSKLGPSFVKIGQALSSRPDLLPRDYLEVLSGLQVCDTEISTPSRTPSGVVLPVDVLRLVPAHRVTHTSAMGRPGVQSRRFFPSQRWSNRTVPTCFLSPMWDVTTPCRLQDRLPSFPTEKAFAVIEEELGRPIGEMFAEISEKPVAAASLGQVRAYRA